MPYTYVAAPPLLILSRCRGAHLFLGGKVDLVRVRATGGGGGPLARARVGGPRAAGTGAGAGAHRRVLLGRVVARALARRTRPARAPRSRHHVLRRRLVARAVQRRLLATRAGRLAGCCVARGFCQP